jgi:hypothetical protein
MKFLKSLKELLIGSLNDKINDNLYGFKKIEYSNGSFYESSRLYYDIIYVSFELNSKVESTKKTDNVFLVHAANYEGQLTPEKGDYVIILENNQLKLGRIYSKDTFTRDSLPKPLMEITGIQAYSKIQKYRRGNKYCYTDYFDLEFYKENPFEVDTSFYTDFYRVIWDNTVGTKIELFEKYGFDYTYIFGDDLKSFYIEDCP